MGVYVPPMACRRKKAKNVFKFLISFIENYASVHSKNKRDIVKINQNVLLCFGGLIFPLISIEGKCLKSSNHIKDFKRN